MSLRETFDPVWQKSVPIGEAGERLASQWLSSMWPKVVVRPAPNSQPWPKLAGDKYDIVVSFEGRQKTVEVTHDAGVYARKGRFAKNPPHICLQTEEMGKPSKLTGAADWWLHIVGLNGVMFLFDRQKLLDLTRQEIKKNDGATWWDDDMGTAKSKGARMTVARFSSLPFIKRSSPKTAQEAIDQEMVYEFITGK